MSLKVSISSPPDRAFLVADIMQDHIQIAEVNIESGKLEVEIYSHTEGLPWKCGFSELLAALNQAEKRLTDATG